MSIHKSKVDIWLMAAIIGSFTLPMVLSLLLGEASWIIFSVCCLALVFLAWLYLATKYVIKSNSVTIHGGIFKVEIPIDDINSISHSRNPLASPAFSLDRLQISYGDNKTVLISPENKSEFLSDIGWTEKVHSEFQHI